jgi:Holliday junction resolvase-like predicted endonuclease
MDSKHKGAHSELVACKWLLEQGYEVFRNISPFGLMDIVAIKGDEVLKIDVKSGRRSLKKYPRAVGVVALNVHANGECTFEKRAFRFGLVHRSAGLNHDAA